MRSVVRKVIWYAPLLDLHDSIHVGMGCRRCGLCCCVQPIMTYNEAVLVSEFLDEVRPIDFAPIPNMCQFLRPDGLCHIYEVRPTLCRMHDCPRCEKIHDGLTPVEIRALLIRLLLQH